ncbi:MAG: hypothetical protein ACI9TO_001327 [Rickettsiales bacterium]|jgi:hypothetical protein
MNHNSTEKKENFSQNSQNVNQNDFWFYIPHHKWFLSSKETELIQGKGDWVSKEKTNKVVKDINAKKTQIKINPDEVEIVETKDPELLSQYYALRESIYRKEWGFVNYDGRENEFDRKGKIFLGVLNGKVVAGVKVVISSDFRYLSHEYPEKDFTYQKICRNQNINVDLSNVLYSEISALIISRDLKKGFLDKIFQFITNYNKDHKIKYMFGVADRANIRDYKQSFKKIGIKLASVDSILAPKKSELNDINCYPIIIFF